MNVLYHLVNANVVVDALSRLSKKSVAYLEERKKKLVREVHQLARLGVWLVDSIKGSVWVQNGLKSSLVFEVTEKQDKDPIFLQLKEAIQNQKVEVFSQGGEGVLHCQSRLCFPNVDDLRQQMLVEAHGS